MELIDRDALLETLKKDPLFPLVEQYGITNVIEAQPVLMKSYEYVIATDMLTRLAKKLDEAILNGVSDSITSK